MISFVSYTAAETSNAFQWAGNPQKLPFAVEISGPYLIYGSRESPPPPECISIGSAVFFAALRTTDRPTDHATPSVAVGRSYCMH